MTNQKGKNPVNSRLTSFTRLLKLINMPLSVWGYRIHKPLRGPQHMVRVILTGTIIVICVLLLLLLSSLMVLHNTYVVSRFWIGIGVFLYLMFVTWAVKKQRYKFAAWMLLVLYGLAATYVLIFWGINAPVGILTLAFVILLSAVMLGANYIIPVTLGVISLLGILQILSVLEIIKPDRTSLSIESSFGDVISYSTIFGVFALIAWLAGRQMERALRRALEAEQALEKEKELLATRLQEQSQKLKEIQLQEMQQLYSFAELGQLTTVILHELANHLSVLNLDIDDLEQNHKHSYSVTKAKESISYIDNMVQQVRKQLKESSNPGKFNAVLVINETIGRLSTKATKNGVTLEMKRINIRRSFYIHGDPLRFSQVMTILINNAIDASTSKDFASVYIVCHAISTHLRISVIDEGIGIPMDVRQMLFKPLLSRKKHGLGIGLFIASQIIMSHFKGTISLSPKDGRTEFIIEIPEYSKISHH